MLAVLQQKRQNIPAFGQQVTERYGDKYGNQNYQSNRRPGIEQDV